VKIVWLLGHIGETPLHLRCSQTLNRLRALSPLQVDSRVPLQPAASGRPPVTSFLPFAVLLAPLSQNFECRIAEQCRQKIFRFSSPKKARIFCARSSDSEPRIVTSLGPAPGRTLSLRSQQLAAAALPLRASPSEILLLDYLLSEQALHLSRH